MKLKYFFIIGSAFLLASCANRPDLQDLKGEWRVWATEDEAFAGLYCFEDGQYTIRFGGHSMTHEVNAVKKISSNEYIFDYDVKGRNIEKKITLSDGKKKLVEAIVSINSKPVEPDSPYAATTSGAFLYSSCR